MFALFEGFCAVRAGAAACAAAAYTELAVFDAGCFRAVVTTQDEKVLFVLAAVTHSLVAVVASFYGTNPQNAFLQKLQDGLTYSQSSQ